MSDARRELLEQYVSRVLAARERLAPVLPEVAPEDLLLILQSLLRPPELGRHFLLRSPRPGV